MDDDAGFQPEAAGAFRPIMLGLLTAVVFEILTVLATQDRAIRAVSPWQDDPYVTVLSVTQFAVPMIAVVIGLRLLAWGAPGQADRCRQMRRATAMLVALVALAAGFQWAAFAAGARRALWTGRTGLLAGGLAVVSVFAVAVAVQLVRAARSDAAGRKWDHDWLGDVVLLCARVPVLRRCATEQRLAWIRRHAMLVFSTLSVLAGCLEISGMVVADHWTDPLLISWAVIVVAASDLAFCVISNAVAGFIARPPRRRAQRMIETAVVVGSIAALSAVAFHTELWRVGSRHPLDSVVPLVALTLGIGVAAAAITAVIVSRGAPASMRLSKPGT